MKQNGKCRDRVSHRVMVYRSLCNRTGECTTTNLGQEARPRSNLLVTGTEQHLPTEEKQYLFLLQLKKWNKPFVSWLHSISLGTSLIYSSVAVPPARETQTVMAQALWNLGQQMRDVTKDSIYIIYNSKMHFSKIRNEIPILVFKSFWNPLDIFQQVGGPVWLLSVSPHGPCPAISWRACEGRNDNLVMLANGHCNSRPSLLVSAEKLVLNHKSCIVDLNRYLKPALLHTRHHLVLASTTKPKLSCLDLHQLWQPVGAVQLLQLDLKTELCLTIWFIQASWRLPCGERCRDSTS